MGLYIRLAPGLKLRATSRGLRVGVGPRQARMWMGAGGTGVSTGAGPVSVYRNLGGTSRGRAPSLTAYERQLRQAQQAEELAALANQLQAMLSLHQEDFPPAQPPVAPPPEPLDVASLEKQAVKAAKAGVSFFNRSERREAGERARTEAREEAAAEMERREANRREVQRELDEQWHRLLSNDPGAVIATLEAAFADNAAPAVPVDCTDGRVTVLMVMEAEDAFPERVPNLTPTGKPSSRKLSKTERSELYVAWMSSNILATVREALTVAPATLSVTVAVLKKGSRTPFGETPLGVVYAGTLTRQMCDRIEWARPEALDAISYADDVLMETKGRAKQLVDIDLSDHPDLQVVVAEVRQAFELPPAPPGRED
jgi:hypothetical protein